MRDIADWLRDLGLEEYVPLFEQHRIDLGVLPELTDGDLRELEIPLGHRKKLLRCIADEGILGEGSPGPDRHGASARSSEAIGEAERRQLTIMFCDLVGSTWLSGRLDPEDLRALITHFQDLCRTAVERYDGFVARYMGDGVLIYFGYPRSHESDAERAVLAGLDLLNAVRELDVPEAPGESRGLAVRIGISTGLVVVGDLIGDGASQESPVVGETPNIAARLQSIAEPNTIVVSQTTRRLLGRAFEYRELGAQQLKGVSAPVEAWRIIGEGSVESRFEATEGAGLTPLVGREEEVRLLRNRWERAGSGEGQVVLVSGEAGIGKSRLTEEVRGLVQGGEHIRIGYQCIEHHQDSALHPVIAQLERSAGIRAGHAASEKLARLESLPGLTGEGERGDISLLAGLLSIPLHDRYPETYAEPEERKKQTLEALVRRLESLASRGAVLCVFEDVHWIDPSTLELLEMIVDRASALPMLVVVTCRPEFRASWMGQSHTSMLALSRMDQRHARDIVSKLTGTRTLSDTIVSEIVEKTDGIPLFIEELTRTLLDSSRDGTESAVSESTAIPATLQDSLMARLDRLSVGKTVAQVAAVLGREFSHEQITAASDLDVRETEAGLAELTTSGLVFARGSGAGASYIFKHALVQDIAYQSLLRSARRSLHLRIATLLCGRFPETVEIQPELVARHFAEAGDSVRAAEHWRLAGERAANRGAHSEAVGHFSRALDAVDDLDDADLRVEVRVSCSLGLAASMHIVDRWDEALRVLGGAETVAIENDRFAELAQLHTLKGNIYFPLGKMDECLREHQSSRDFARRAGLLEAEARALGGMGDAYYQRGRLVTAYEHFGECLEICRNNGFQRIEAAYLSMRGITGQYLLRFREAIECARDGIARARAVHNLRAEVVSQQALSYLLIDMGRLDEALDASEKALEVCRRLGSGVLGASAQAHCGRVLFEIGRLEQSLALLHESWDSAKTSGQWFVGPTILGYLAVATHDPSERSWALAEGERVLAEGSVSHNYLRFFRFAIDASLANGLWEEAERYAAALEEYTRPEPLPWAEFVIERARALAAIGRGQRDTHVLDTLTRLRDRAVADEFIIAVQAIDAALSDAA